MFSALRTRSTNASVCHTTPDQAGNGLSLVESGDRGAHVLDHTGKVAAKNGTIAECISVKALD